MTSGITDIVSDAENSPNGWKTWYSIFSLLLGFAFIADKLCNNIVCVILYQLRPSIPMRTMLFCIYEVCFEGAFVMVNVRRTRGTSVPWWDEIDGTGSCGTAVRFGNDRTVFVATVNFEASIVGCSVAVVEDFLTSQLL